MICKGGLGIWPIPDTILQTSCHTTTLAHELRASFATPEVNATRNNVMWIAGTVMVENNLNFLCLLEEIAVNSHSVDDLFSEDLWERNLKRVD